MRCRSAESTVLAKMHQYCRKGVALLHPVWVFISVHAFQYPVSYHQLRVTSFDRKIIFLIVLSCLLSFNLSKPLNFLDHIVPLMCLSMIQPPCAPKHTLTTELSVFQWWVRLLLEQEALWRISICRTYFSLEPTKTFLVIYTSHSWDAGILETEISWCLTVYSSAKKSHFKTWSNNYFTSDILLVLSLWFL